VSKIQVLSHQEAQKIAAGEVIERPAHIVKELLENALDAQATTLSLYIEKAGKKLIRIVDNGCGMSPEDARICFLPHATSKISKVEQLETINTYGFRGEALASISAVSNVILTSKEKTRDLGIEITCKQGTIEHEKQIACPDGTSISIHDLFYNIPVRKKFLKQDETEWNQIQTLFHAFCLSHKHIYFKLYRDNKLILNAPPVNTIKERASQIWGYNFSQNLLEIQNENTKQETNKHTWLSITGYTSNHNFWRYGRQIIFFFVNNRWVKNIDLSKALMKGYLNVLPPARFPAAFVFLNLDANMVDVNVHPKKEEVRFLKPNAVRTAIQTYIKQTLSRNLTQQITLEKPTQNIITQQDTQNNFKNPRAYTPEIPVFTQPTFNTHEFKIQDQQNTHEISFFSKQTPKEIPEQSLEKNTQIKHETNQKTIPETNPDNTNTNASVYSGKIIGQLFKTYILLENKNNFTIIDQHAAHERVLYEKFLENFEKKEGTHLLFPEIIRLSKEQLNLIMQEKKFFAQHGIKLEQFGEQEVVIKTSPPKIQDKSLRELILETVAFIEENERIEPELFRKKLHEHMHSHMACKMAVKAGDILTFELMKQLVLDLQKTEKQFICVHGRPTTWTLTQEEIEKKFRRR